MESVRRGIWEGQNGGMFARADDKPVPAVMSSTNLASRHMVDKRARNEEKNEAKRRKIENGEEVSGPIYATHFAPEDIENEQRRPKKKVAVLIGYAGTGYHGMQLYGS